MQSLIGIVTSGDPKIRNQSLDAHCRNASLGELLAACADLESFRQAMEKIEKSRPREVMFFILREYQTRFVRVKADWRGR